LLGGCYSSFYRLLLNCLDLMDGYFPSELQDRFPDGVIFQVCVCVMLISMERFLSKLPENVVKGGKVISIRSSLKAHLQVRPPHTIIITIIFSSREAIGSAAEVTTLRVKSEDGEKTFIMKMLFTDTIGHLRQHLDAHSPAYDIISGFPQRCHSDDTQTLQAYGLTPNAALLLRPHIDKKLKTSYHAVNYSIRRMTQTEKGVGGPDAQLCKKINILV
uniref:UBX domain-containing protein n=1 Tax=Astyanax mexicanus TaxID=7994 RepID=A0A8B9HLC6_ASTMX